MMKDSYDCLVGQLVLCWRTALYEPQLTCGKPGRPGAFLRQFTGFEFRFFGFNQGELVGLGNWLFWVYRPGRQNP